MEQKSKNWKDVAWEWSKMGLTIVILFIVLFITINPVENHTDENTVVNNINQKEKISKEIQTVVLHQKDTVYAISSEALMLRDQLKNFKFQRDTVMILAYSDTLIQKQDHQIGVLNRIVSNQDSVISLKDYIITSKDTLIALDKKKIKKLKRQRNIALGAAVLATGVAILK